MTLRLAINGYGRIGRCLLRALHESAYRDAYRVVAINEPADLASIEYLTRFDSTHGRFPGVVETEANTLVVDGQRIAVTHETTPEAVNWAGLNIDLVIECSGHYGTRAELQRFIDAGCPRILLSHPANSAEDVDATIVFGINHDTLTGRERIVSNASCTTNAVVPVLDIIDQAYGVNQAILTTIHSVMNDQPLIDGYHHTDLRRTRSAMQSIIPVATGLARGVERLLPSLSGRVQAKAIRVPTLNVSAIELALTVRTPVSSVETINQLLADAAHRRHQARLAYTEQAHASIDFNHDPHSAVIDGGQTRVGGEHLLSLLIWFDNEWGFASRMVDVLHHWHPSWPSTDSLDSLLETPQ
ncbi:type I glyceraldehyde-3-phosphate dehydrogenase [Denitromonas halophila]|uniref:Erythrose-4-phosphate dehydrogenase n=1 Tax=Denitromonas halophila TaxID=1629404 RepID=A0A557QE32_9RHOO|nr:glyceraldehyde 3-phosphate dehydrogenase NAD-binding domain-containing protein [Denitromonas halophila]TVO51188.1 erythrose-4-phosphate dehydrogenase [Denitromonas halophila]